MSNDTPGILFVYFEIAALLTVPVSLILILWYRRAVAREMLAGVVEGPAAQDFNEAHNGAVGAVAPSFAEAWTRGLRRRLAAVYACGAVAASVALTFIWFHLPDPAEFTPFRGFVVAYDYGWLLTPTLALMLARSRRETALLLVGYAIVGAIIVFLWSSISSLVHGKTDVSAMSNVGFQLYHLLITGGPPAAIILLTGFAKIRPVAPLVLAGLVTFSFGARGAETLFIALVDSNEMTRNLLLAAPYPRFTFFMLAALPVGYWCWLLLRGLSWGFEKQKFSDIQLVADSWWLIAIFWVCLDFSTKIGWWGLLGMLAFVAYRGAVALGLAFLPREAAPATPDLLLLRVFGCQSRTERLFDVIAQPWRFDGPVNMIAGADLAGRVIDPGDIVTFAGGRLRDHFVRDGGDLQRQLGRLDEGRDPDGRFRINKFFCTAASWQEAVKALMRRSALVLMDLRGFSRDNSGCLFELQTLASSRKLGRTLCVVDKTTDIPLLRSVLQNAHCDAGGEGEAPLHLLSLERQGAHDLERLASELRALAVERAAPAALSVPSPA